MAFSLLPRRRPPRPPTPKPAIKTEAEIIADAKADVVPTLNRPLSAVLWPEAIWRRYRRHELANGKVITIPGLLLQRCWLPYLAGVLVFGLFTAMFLFAGSPIVTSAPTGAIMGIGLIWYMVIAKLWNTVYGTLYISYNSDQLRPWQSYQFMRLHVARLIFKDRQSEVFYGSYEKGYMRIETSAQELTGITEQRTFYAMSPGVRQMPEGPLVDSHSRMRSTEANALAIHQTKNKSISQHLAENFGFIIGAIFIVIGAYCLLQMQDGELLGRPDVEDHRLHLEAQRAVPSGPEVRP